MQMSSAQVAMLGNRSEKYMPLRPYCLNVRGDPITRAESFWMKAKRSPLSSDSGSGLPAISLSFGLGSNKSTWLVPPERKKKIQFFALPGKCDGRGASGLMIFRPASAANVWRDSNDAR